MGFFLTAGFLGMMYYYIPKQAERPVYSYRLSIVHFWTLTFLYIWAGPHHLHYTALPDWTQTLGMVMSILLWMPSWGGMINGVMTLSGAWHKLRTDPVLRFLVTSVAFYGMSTFEGPMMAIRAVNSLSHYTDWTIGHVHSGALGWVAFISFGALYFVVPRLWNRERLYSLRLVNYHFWIGTIGIVLYITAMWISGIMQGLMWRAYDELGFLQYSFVETVEAMHPYYVIRAGALSSSGPSSWPTTSSEPSGRSARQCFRDVPHVVSVARREATMSWNLRNKGPRLGYRRRGDGCIGGLVQWCPFTMEQVIEKVEGVRPYSPLELAGRLRPADATLPFAKIRPFRDEAERCGHYSLAAESMYIIHQWGSKRTGPDLARVGGKYSNDWHVAHLIRPQAVVPESVMPQYPFLAKRRLDFYDVADHMRTLRVVGVPYTDEQIANARDDLRAQATGEGDTDALLERYPKAVLGNFDGRAMVSEMDALVSYLQMLGTLVDFAKVKPEEFDR